MGGLKNKFKLTAKALREITQNNNILLEKFIYQDMKYEEIAKELGVSVFYAYNCINKSDKTPQLEYWRKLAEIFDIPLTELFYYFLYQAEKKGENK